MSKNKPKIKIVKNGPYRVSGNVPMAKQIIDTDKDGYSVGWKKGESYPEKEEYSLCRCGRSCKKPYCDDTHKKIIFDGTEIARKKKYIDRAEKTEGPELILTDVEDLCASARFCDRAGGTWKLTEESNVPQAKEIAIQEACDCPSGRLIAWDKRTGKAIEPKFEPSIGLVEDPQNNVSGPVWLRGGIPIESADGEQYEARNRVTLCRCGRSENKPFCDGTHISAKFSDDN